MSKEVLFGHLGNGVTVWLEGEDEHLAHISRSREVNFMKYPVDPKVEKKVHRYAEQMDPSISVSQDDMKVFEDPPIVFCLPWITKRDIEFINPNELHYRGWKYKWDGSEWKRIEKLPV